ncbi:hypothetical protein ACH5RR_027914 [Cinchona calisaya]|uniref:FHA domain-containing protein n=1 Tax=Cinchona calisaya TaxID=153742 RepID=A0ABD2YMA5_9GENT
MGRNDSESPPRGRGSPRRRSPSRRERSPARHRSSHKTNSTVTENTSAHNRSPESRSPVREKSSSHKKPPYRRKSISPASPSPIKERSSNRTRSPKRANSGSPEYSSRSPRTKRLKRAQAEREAEKASEREHERAHGKRGDRASNRKRDSEKEVSNERGDRRSGRDGVDNVSSRSRHGRSASPRDYHHSSRHRSRSPPVADKRARDEGTNSRGSDHRNGDDDSVSKMKATEAALESKEKEKPSFELSGKLAAETNRFRGITLLFTEPPDARMPPIRWRLYVFKAGDVLNEPLYVHRQSCYLFGRERRVADIPTDHPSCSKQHAVLQYRQVEKENPDGTSSKIVRPYVMDLGSTNGTFINDNRIEPQRYYELFEKDMLKFGNSSREYVLLHENSAG